MTSSAQEFAEVKRIGQALDHLVNAVESVGLEIARVADSLDEIKSATVEETARPLYRDFPTGDDLIHVQPPLGPLNFESAIADNPCSTCGTVAVLFPETGMLMCGNSHCSVYMCVLNSDGTPRRSSEPQQ